MIALLTCAPDLVINETSPPKFFCILSRMPPLPAMQRIAHDAVNHIAYVLHDGLKRGS